MTLPESGGLETKERQETGESKTETDVLPTSNNPDIGLNNNLSVPLLKSGGQEKKRKQETTGESKAETEVLIVPTSREPDIGLNNSPAAILPKSGGLEKNRKRGEIEESKKETDVLLVPTSRKPDIGLNDNQSVTLPKLGCLEKERKLETATTLSGLEDCELTTQPNIGNATISNLNDNTIAQQSSCDKVPCTSSLKVSAAHLPVSLCQPQVKDQTNVTDFAIDAEPATSSSTEKEDRNEVSDSQSSAISSTKEQTTNTLPAPIAIENDEQDMVSQQLALNTARGLILEGNHKRFTVAGNQNATSLAGSPSPPTDVNPPSAPIPVNVPNPDGLVYLTNGQVHPYPNQYVSLVNPSLNTVYNPGFNPVGSWQQLPPYPYNPYPSASYPLMQQSITGFGPNYNMVYNSAIPQAVPTRLQTPPTMPQSEMTLSQHAAAMQQAATTVLQNAQAMSPSPLTMPQSALTMSQSSPTTSQSTPTMQQIPPTVPLTEPTMLQTEPAVSQSASTIPQTAVTTPYHVNLVDDIEQQCFGYKRKQKPVSHKKYDLAFPQALSIPRSEPEDYPSLPNHWSTNDSPVKNTNSSEGTARGASLADSMCDANKNVVDEKGMRDVNATALTSKAPMKSNLSSPTANERSVTTAKESLNPMAEKSYASMITRPKCKFAL